MKDSFIFYRSFYDAISDLEIDHQHIMYLSIIEYSLNQKKPQIDGVLATIWKLIKPQLDANIKRYENGKKGADFGKLGGRPKKGKKTPKKPLNNPTGVFENNPKETPNKNVNDNVNDNVNVNAYSVKQAELIKMVSRYQQDNSYPYTPDEVQYFLSYWNEVNDGKVRWTELEYFDIGLRLKRAYERYKVEIAEKEQSQKELRMNNRMNTDL